MANQIKHGLIGMIVGLLISLAGVGIATGTYKQKVDTNCQSIREQSLEIGNLGNAVVGLSRDSGNNKELLIELRTGQQEMLKKMDW